MTQDNGLDLPEQIILDDVKAAFNWLIQKGKKEDGIHFTDLGGSDAWVVRDKGGNLYAYRQAIWLAYGFTLSRLGCIKEEPPFIADENYIPHSFPENYEMRKLWRRLGFTPKRRSEITTTSSSEVTGEIQTMNNNIPLKAHELFKKEFRQIILFGPPGTGKTYSAKKVLESLFEVDEEELDGMQDKDWDIVQFHPSYNYEDFVRGVKVETRDNQIMYKAVNRVFGEMCERAKGDKNNYYALIIDEINRANVSAVLGELIYALEYRGKSIKTPYTIGDSAKLIIPKNLYIIGTMNTADRTIGQIDYAVRRRFAFVHCLPEKSVIEEEVENSTDACGFFNDVEKVFDDISQDFEPNDVRIGHSYFLAEGDELAYKILYQVIPILREYVKDGVLLESAKSAIDSIEERAKKY